MAAQYKSFEDKAWGIISSNNYMVLATTEGKFHRELDRLL